MRFMIAGELMSTTNATMTSVTDTAVSNLSRGRTTSRVATIHTSITSETVSTSRLLVG